MSDIPLNLIPPVNAMGDQIWHLQADNLSFTVDRALVQGGRQIVHDSSMQASSGSFIGICGPNGAGKSTLLRMLGGLLRPAAGQIRLNQTELNRFRLKTLARISAYMHQDTAMPFDFSVRDVVLMGRHPYRNGLSAWSAEDQNIAENCMELTDCQSFADQVVTRLSGGERQRVMFARVLSQQTPILLLDEPTASLDVYQTDATLDLCRQMAAQGRLVIAVLHDLRSAARYCDRLLLMHQGQIVADGDPVEVLHEGHLAYVYGIHAKTFSNPIGQWDYYLVGSNPASDNPPSD